MSQEERELDDASITTYLNDLMDDDIAIADTFLIYELERKEENTDRRARIIEKNRPKDGTVKWLIPINFKEFHWILAVVSFEKRVIVIYDSLKKNDWCLEMAQTVRNVLVEMGYSNNWMMIRRDCFLKKQPDTVSCGIFLICAAFLNIVYKHNIIVDINMLCSPWNYLRDIDLLRTKQDYNKFKTKYKHPSKYLRFKLE